MGEAESKAPQAKRNHDAEEANAIGSGSEKNRIRATRSLGKSQSSKEDGQSLVRFPSKRRTCLSRSLVPTGQGRELVFPAV
jgi:hypothetical protein